MTAILHVNSRAIESDEIVPLLKQYQLLPRLIGEVIIDQAIADIDYSDEELAAMRQEMMEGRSPDAEIDEAIVIRHLKIQKFKQAQWQSVLFSHFLKRKSDLDQVIYSLVQTHDSELALELYFRIQEQEQTFAELAKTYSEGPEARTGGLIGPLEIGSHSAHFKQILLTYHPGQLTLPMALGDWTILVRIEERLPAQLNDAIQQRLLDELFDEWVNKQLNQLPHQTLHNPDKRHKNLFT